MKYYCDFCGQVISTYLGARWQPLLNDHKSYPYGIPVECPGSSQPPGARPA